MAGSRSRRRSWLTARSTNARSKCSWTSTRRFAKRTVSPRREPARQMTTTWTPDPAPIPPPGRMTMSLKNDAKQNLDKITESQAFQLFAGVGDLATEKLRVAQAKLAGIDLQAKLAEVPQRLARAQEAAQAKVSEVPDRLAAMKSEPKAVKDAAKRVPERAQDLALLLAGKAVQTYAELAERGRIVLERQRGTARSDAPVVSIVEPSSSSAAPDAKPVVSEPRPAATSKSTATAKAPAKKSAAKKPSTGPTKSD